MSYRVICDDNELSSAISILDDAKTSIDTASSTISAFESNAKLLYDEFKNLAIDFAEFDVPDKNGTPIKGRVGFNEHLYGSYDTILNKYGNMVISLKNKSSDFKAFTSRVDKILKKLVNIQTKINEYENSNSVINLEELISDIAKKEGVSLTSFDFEVDSNGYTIMYYVDKDGNKISISDMVNAFYTYTGITMNSAVATNYYLETTGNNNSGKFLEMMESLIDTTTKNVNEWLKSGYFGISSSESTIAAANSVGGDENLTDFDEDFFKGIAWGAVLGNVDLDAWMKALNQSTGGAITGLATAMFGLIATSVNEKNEEEEKKYDSRGFDKDGNHKNGTKYDDRGFDKDGNHKNGTKYDDEGYDVDGYNKRGFDKDGNHKNGTKYDDRGFDKDGNHKNGTKYDDEGYDVDGYDKDGYNKDGYDRNGNKKATDEGPTYDGTNSSNSSSSNSSSSSSSNSSSNNNSSSTGSSENELEEASTEIPTIGEITIEKDYDAMAREKFESLGEDVIAKRREAIINMANYLFDSEDKTALIQKLASYGYSDVDIEKIIVDRELTMMALIEGDQKIILAQYAKEFAEADNVKDFDTKYDDGQKYSDLVDGTTSSEIIAVMSNNENIVEARNEYNDVLTAYEAVVNDANVAVENANIAKTELTELKTNIEKEAGTDSAKWSKEQVTSYNEAVKKYNDSVNLVKDKKELVQAEKDNFDKARHEYEEIKSDFVNEIKQNNAGVIGTDIEVLTVEQATLADINTGVSGVTILGSSYAPTEKKEEANEGKINTGIDGVIINGIDFSKKEQ